MHRTKRQHSVNNRSPRSITNITHHEVHRSRPRTGRAIRRDIYIGLRFIDHRLEPNKLPGIASRTPHILQFEHHLEDLGNGLLGVGHPRTIVETGAIEVVHRLGTARIDLRGIREFGGLMMS